MDRIKTEEVNMPTTLIDVDPTALRSIAERLELMAAKGQPGTSILVPFSRNVTLHYKVKEEIKTVMSSYRDSHQEFIQ